MRALFCIPGQQRFIEDSVLESPESAATIMELLHDSTGRSAMGKAARALGVPDAAHRLALRIISLAGTNKGVERNGAGKDKTGAYRRYRLAQE